MRIKGQMRLRELKSARKADHRGGSICIMFQGYCFTANELKVDGIIGESDYYIVSDFCWDFFFSFRLLSVR